MRLVFIMALRDYWHERGLSLCAVLALAAALAPLLLLFGVRNGIVTSLQEQLLSDPRNLELIPAGSGKYDAAFFETLRAHPGTGYLVPQTRSIAATLSLLPQDGPHGTLAPASVEASLIPSGPGDPLPARFTSATAARRDGAFQVILSESAAAKLGKRAGDTLTGRVFRSRGTVKEQAETPLVVAAVLPPEALQRDAVFAPLDLLEAVEAYRDGLAVPELGWRDGLRPEAPQAETRLYPSFRLYAKTLEAVAPLRDALTARHVDVTTRAADIESVMLLDRSSTLIFSLICLAAGIGLFASTASTITANIRRKRHIFGIFRLIGLSGTRITLFPLVQALFTALLGTASALTLYGCIATLINRLFPAPGGLGTVCRLDWTHMALACGTVIGLSLLAALPPSLSAPKLSPTEVIRNA